MLTDKQLNALLSVFDARMQPIKDKYLRQMGEHIKRIGKLSASDTLRVTEMQRMGTSVRGIQRELSKLCGESLADIRRIFEAAAEADVDFAATMLGASKTRLDRTALKRVIEAQSRQTLGEMLNLSQTTIVDSVYRNAVDSAIQAVETGMTDYNSAIRSTMRECGLKGLQVQYPSGYRRRADTAVRQNILDGVRQLNQKVLDQAGEDFGADGVELSAHFLCAQDHVPYQGKQYTRKAFEQLQGTLERPIGQWNCKHIAFPIMRGISEAAYTGEELAQMKAYSMERIEIDGKSYTRYEWTQVQRQLETAVRREKDVITLAKASGDRQLVSESRRNIKELDASYKRISDAAGLEEQRIRMRVSRDGMNGMFRKKGNTGDFSHVPERMSKKHIREIAKEYDIDLKGITLVIDDDPRKLSSTFRICGRADTQTVGRIDFFPKAFLSKEELTRTLFHERMHVAQFKEYGALYVQNNSPYFEDLVKDAEDAFIKALKEARKL